MNTHIHQDPKEGKVYDSGGRRIGPIIEDTEREVALSAFAAEQSRLVKMDLSSEDVRIPATEPGAEFRARMADAIAPVAAPVFLVKKRDGYFFGEATSDATAEVVGLAGNAADPFGLNPAVASTKFSCVDYGVGARLSPQLIKQADFDVEEMATLRCMQALTLAWERRVMTLLTTSANWASANVTTIGATAKWNGGSTKTPLADWQGLRAATTLPTDTLIVSEKAEIYWNGSSDVVAFRQGGGELPRLLVARAKNTATGSPSYVWGNDAVVIRTPRGPLDLSTARTFRWLGVGPDGVAKDGFYVRRFIDERTGARGMVNVGVFASDCEAFLSNTIGGVLKGVYQ